MEIKGDDFLKKIQVHQEREELEQKLNDLEEVEKSINSMPPPSSNRIKQEPDEQELGDIMLETSSNEENKKKYLILGLVLVVLFLFTIIVIRLLTDNSKEDPFTSNNIETEMSQTKEDANIEENFQKIMNDRVKKNNTENEDIISEEKLNEIKQNVIDEENNSRTAITENDLDRTIEKIKEKKKQEVVEKQVVAQKPVVKKEEPQINETPSRSVKELVQTSSNSKPVGYFVQIGAFSKKPSDKYINNIRNAGLKYKVYQVDVKGKLYNKVLIGPYSSRATAKNNVDDIKKKLNISSAYVLKF